MGRSGLFRVILGGALATTMGAFTACGSSDREFGAGVAGAGGSSGSETGGTKSGSGGNTGGARSSGGARASGGASSGGSSGAGGRSGSGGGAGAGGSVPDGSAGADGSAGSGGSIGSGGSSGAGGATTGGAVGTGGRATGGVANTGGAPPVCTGVDQGASDYPEWHMPTEPTLTLPNVQSFTILPTVVNDDVTGLVWQRAASTTTMTQPLAATYCQNLVLAGCNDWRLPTMFELVSITDLTAHDPAIDSSVFPSTPVGLFWSSTPAAADPARAWIVSFIYSDANFDSTTAKWYARCVRDPVVHTGTRYTVNTDTVVDKFTGLTWQRNPSTTQRSHADAKTYCSNVSLGGVTGWRLPARNELLTVVDVTKGTVAVDTTVFGIPATVNYFWSASIDATSSNPWFIAFRESGVTFADPIPTAGVRCVR